MNKYNLLITCCLGRCPLSSELAKVPADGGTAEASRGRGGGSSTEGTGRRGGGIVQKVQLGGRRYSTYSTKGIYQRIYII